MANKTFTSLLPLGHKKDVENPWAPLTEDKDKDKGEAEAEAETEADNNSAVPAGPSTLTTAPIVYDSSNRVCVDRIHARILEKKGL